jgi:hypothetical protein
MPRPGFIVAAVALAIALVGGVAAAADREDDAVLPKGRIGVWSAERLRAADPPGIDGAVAQVREKGEGRFAVLCERGDDKAFVAWRAPKEGREALRALGDSIEVAFVFDGERTIERTMRWDEAGRYWKTRFGRGSRFADALRERFELTVRPAGAKAAGGAYTLKTSWRSIEAMFEMCGM